jgi:hypothetical protein
VVLATNNKLPKPKARMKVVKVQVVDGAHVVEIKIRKAESVVATVDSLSKIYAQGYSLGVFISVGIH